MCGIRWIIAFKNCTGLKMISLQSKLETSGDSVFHTYRSLNEIRIPKNVTVIGDCCFRERGLKTVTFDGSALAIGGNAFKELMVQAYYPVGMRMGWMKY